MARIYKPSDRIKVRIDDITVVLAPLTVDQKAEVQQALMKGRFTSDLKELTRGLCLGIGYALKGVEGIEDGEGNPYRLSFEGDVVSQECLNDLMNLELSKKLTMVCTGLLAGIPSQFTDENNEPLQGVEIVKPVKDQPEKNA